MDEIQEAVRWRMEVAPMLAKAESYLTDARANMPPSLERLATDRALIDLRAARRQLNGNLERAEHGEKLRR